jgi:hypothetical protein
MPKPGFPHAIDFRAALRDAHPLQSRISVCHRLTGFPTVVCSFQNSVSTAQPAMPR